MTPTDYRWPVLLFALFFWGCSSPQTTADETPGEATTQTPFYPEFCTRTVDDNDDGKINSYTRQVVDEKGRVLQRMRDRSGDGIFTRVQLATYDEKGRQVVEAVDQSGDGTVDERDTELAEEPLEGSEPKVRPSPLEGDEILDSQQRVIGHRGTITVTERDWENHQIQRSEWNAIQLHFFDDQHRVTSVWTFRSDPDLDVELDEPTLRQAVHFDPDTERWNVDLPEHVVMSSAYLTEYDEDGLVGDEASWSSLPPDGIPSLNGNPFDGPHQRQQDPDDRVLAIPPIPEWWHQHLQTYIARTHDDDGNLLDKRYYFRPPKKRADHDRLMRLHRVTRFSYDEQGHQILHETDNTDSTGQSGHADGIIDSILREIELEAGQPVRARSLLVSVQPDRTIGEIPERWRSVEFDVEETSPQKPALMETFTIDHHRDDGGNETKRIEQRTLGVNHFQYDDRQRLKKVELTGNTIRSSTGTFLLNHRGSRPLTTGLVDHELHYSYDDDRLVESILKDRFRPGRDRQYITSYEYDGQGRLAREVITVRVEDRSSQSSDGDMTSPVGALTYEYDEQGRKTRAQFVHDSRADKNYDLSFHYDDRQRLTMEKYTDPHSGDPEKRIEYEYAEGENPIGARLYTVPGPIELAKGLPADELVLSSVTEFVYDEHGHLAEEINQKPRKITRFGYDCY